VENKMKKELNLDIESHMKLLEDTAFEAISGISAKEILELKAICSKDRYTYFNLVKLRYIVPLGMLGFTYQINTAIEKVLFYYINYLIHALPAEQYEDSAVFNIS
jgi:hypothetical protein